MLRKQFTPLIDEILRSSDLSTVSVKKIRNALAEQCEIDFTPLKVRSLALLCSLGGVAEGAGYKL